MVVIRHLASYKFDCLNCEYSWRRSVKRWRDMVIFLIFQNGGLPRSWSCKIGNVICYILVFRVSKCVTMPSFVKTDRTVAQTRVFNSFYSAPQCSHCKRCTSYGISSVCLFVRPSVSLSVRLSVTRRYFVNKTAHSTVQFALSDSEMCLVLQKPKNIPQGPPNPPWNLGSKWPTLSW